MKISGNLLKIGKGTGRTYSYKCFMNRKTAAESGLEEGDALLLEFNDIVFPTVFHKHKTKTSFTYAFTVPRNVGDIIGKKETRFELTKIARRTRKILMPNQQIDLLVNIKNKTKQGQPIYIFDLGEKIYIWIYSRGSKGFALNRFIPLESKPDFDFFELMGAFHCEGKKSRKQGKRNLDSMIFGNGDPEQILWFADSLEKFGFSRKDFGVQILHNAAQDKASLRTFWLSYGFSEDKLKFYENKTVKSERGICLLAITGTVIGELFYELLEIAKRLAPKNRQYALRFFRGLSRGDIGISRRKNSMGNISYTTENGENALLFRKICNRIGVKCGKEFFIPGVKGFWNVIIFGYENYKKLLMDNAITHAKRKRKLLKLFFGMKNNRSDEYLAAVRDGNRTSGQIADALGISIVSSRAFLQKLRGGKYLKKKGKGNAFIYALAEKGAVRLKEREKMLEQIVD